MNVRALRGVCIGVDLNLVAGDTVDMDDATAQYLIEIGAVEIARDDSDQDESTGSE